MPQVPLAIIDVETTGLHPAYGDRVLEVGIVTLDPDGASSEWSSLVNPERDLGDQAIHGIRGVDVAEAPCFADVIGDITARLDGRGVVANNARFDQLFVESELRKADVEPPTERWNCTMELSRRRGWGASLAAACLGAGVHNQQAHCALDDARACAQVLLALLDEGAADASRWDMPLWPRLPSSYRRCLRGAGARRPAPSAAVLMSRAAAQRAGSGDDAYAQLLAEAMEDRVLTVDAADALRALARDLGLDRSAVHAANVRWLGELLALAQADGVITDRERADLALVADILEVDLETIDPVEFAPRAVSFPPGTTVCFTGALECSLGGSRVTRENAAELAMRAGLRPVKNVTSGCDILVMADPHSQSGKARKARQWGVRIIAESAFWPQIGVVVD